MAPPPEMECSYPECNFSTPPSIPTYELVLKALELQISTAHTPLTINMSNPARQQVSKVEKPKRPSVSSNMSESDWTLFDYKWNRYKRQPGISGQQEVDEIWACLETDIERLTFQDGVCNSDPTQLLKKLKKLEITTVHPAIHVVSLHKLKQNSEETVENSQNCYGLGL